MEFTDLTDHKLVSDLKHMCGMQKRMTARIVMYLAEVEARDIHTAKGYDSLFAFCVRRLKMSHGEAAVRIKVARMYRAHQQIMPPLLRGKVHLTSLYMLRKHMNEDNCDELLKNIKGMTTREVEAYVATHFPRPGIPASIRKTPTPRSTTGDGGQIDAADTPAGLAATSTKSSAAERTLSMFADSSTQAPAGSIGAVMSKASAADHECDSGIDSLGERTDASPAPKRLRPFEQYSHDSHKVQFMVTTKVREKIERAASLSSHRNRGDLAALVEHAIDVLLTKLERQQLGKLSRRHSAAGDVEATPRSSDAHAPLASAPKTATGNGAAAKSNPSTSSASQNSVTSNVSTEAADTSSTSDASSGASSELALLVSSATTESSSIAQDETSTLREEGREGKSFTRAARRAAFERDGEQCSFIGDDGVRCEARSFLQVDHIQPRALGGAGDASNARVLCAAHNQYEARRVFGGAFIDRKIVQSRRSDHGNSVRKDGRASLPILAPSANQAASESLTSEPSDHQPPPPMRTPPVERDPSRPPLS